MGEYVGWRIRSNNNKQDPEQYLSVHIVNGIFYFLLLMFGLFTLSTHVSLVFKFSFATLCKIFSIVSIPAAIIYFYYSTRKKKKLTLDYSTCLAIFLIAFAGLLLSVYINNPSGDDTSIASNAVFALQHPHSSMGFTINSLIKTNFEYWTAVWAISQANAYFWAIVSLVTNLSYVSSYHLIAPAISGAMIPFAWYVLVAKFSDEPWPAVAGAFTITIFLLILGEAPCCYGWFAFTRIWQGVAFLLSVILPLFVKLALDYFENPTAKNWAWLAACAICATGFSSTALFLIPAQALCCAGAYLFVSKEEKKIRTAALYMASVFYPIFTGLSVYTYSSKSVGSGTMAGGTTDIYKAFASVYVGKNSFAFWVVLVFLILAFFLTDEKERKFLFAWLVTGIVIFLNPITDSFVIKYMTSADPYWRLFYVLPFPLVMGVTVAKISSRFVRRQVFFPFYILLLTGMLALSNYTTNLPLWRTKIAKRYYKEMSFRFLEPKINSEIVADIKQIVKIAKKGSLLIPIRYSYITLFNSNLKLMARSRLDFMFYKRKR